MSDDQIAGLERGTSPHSGCPTGWQVFERATVFHVTLEAKNQIHVVPPKISELLNEINLK